ncbi:MAG TPA: SRPBCC family protein [Polyangiaceae bacterium]|nr:SRPBCC family protein [Polyangiaceae bacterium]
MARKILIGVAALIVLLVIVILTRPATFHIERSITMSAPPETAFAQVNDFRAWPAWSPWEKLDPQMKKTFEGPPAGVGAKYAWAGNDKVGEGRMTMEKSEKPSTIGIKLEFLKPFEATNDTTFTFAPAAGGSKVTWAMDGENTFMGKAASLFMDMDKMLGDDFEKGLAAMKTAAEAASKAAPGAAPGALAPPAAP